MGDYFQIIVDRDATMDEAEDLANKVRNTLVEQGIIEADCAPDCIGSQGTGYPPGSNYWLACSASNYDLHRLATNGLAIITGKTVFDAVQGGLNLICRECGTRWPSEEDPAWGEAINEWYADTGPGLLRCLNCGHTDPITDWQFDPPWGFGNLGFKFWNWPQLTESFIEEVGKLLGHRTVYVYGKV